MPPGHSLLPRPSVSMRGTAASLPSLGVGGVPCREFGWVPYGTHPGAGVLPGKVTGEGVSLLGEAAGDPRGARRADAWQELYLEGAIWFGSLPGCCSKLSPELALTLRVQLPSTSIPLPGPTPHSAPFFPLAFLSCGL